MRWAVLVLVACSGKHVAEPAQSPPPPSPLGEPSTATPSASGERPSLLFAAVLPRLDGERPWPLSELPSVQPHWDPAMAHDACTEAWPKRHESDEEAKHYVAAWCRIRASDRGAIDDLGKLARDARPELAKPARLDVVNLIADWMDARHALAWLDSLSLATVPTLDLLAGTYVALDMRDEALVVEDRVAHDDPHPAPAEACERLVSYAHLDDAGVASRLAACPPRFATVRCVLGHWSKDCELEYHRDPDGEAKAAVVGVYQRWSRDPVKLIGIADELSHYFVVHGAEELAVTALEEALGSGACTVQVLDGAAKAAARIRAADFHSPAFDARLAKLHAGCP